MSATEMMEAAEGTTHPETEDVTLSLAGDHDAFQRIYIQYAGLVSSVIHRNNLDNQRDDLMQITFANVFEHLDDVHDVSKLKSWIGAIANRACLTSHRQLQRRRDRASAALGSLQDTSGVDTPLSALIRAEDIQSVRQAIQSLQEPFKTLVELYYLEEMADREVSLKMNRPEGSVKSGLYRARALLRSALKHTEPPLSETV
jgi:RNA polymerase sigma-70 factor, ECF subfamily